MKYVYKDGFEIGHWLFEIVGNFVHLFAIILKIFTLNLIWFDFELNWTVYSLKNADKLTNWFKSLNKL